MTLLSAIAMTTVPDYVCQLDCFLVTTSEESPEFVMLRLTNCITWALSVTVGAIDISRWSLALGMNQSIAVEVQSNLVVPRGTDQSLFWYKVLAAISLRN